MTRKPRARPPIVLWAAIGSAAMVLLTSAFEFSLLDALFILLPLLHLAVGTLFTAVLLWAMIHGIRFRRQGRGAWLPSLIGVATIVALVLVPFNDLWIRARFALTRTAREEVLREIVDGRLQPNVDHNPALIALGDQAPGLSAGGDEIVVEGDYVLFFTFRGILDNYAGFLHVAPGGDPRKYSDLSEAGRTDIVPLEPGWYWVSHH